MSEQDVQRGLEAMSVWTGGETRLWERALESERGKDGEGRRMRVLRFDWMRSPQMAAALAGAVGLGVLLVAVLGGRSGGVGWVPPPRVVGDAAFVERDLDRAGRQAEVAGGGQLMLGRFEADRRSMHADLASQITQQSVSPALVMAMNGDEGTQARLVAYSASISLRSSDVRATAERARALVDPQRGEFVEAATLSGESGAAGASVVLRVRSERLDEVLNALRGMGELLNESVMADDMTTRIVDVEARLRNERRIETELLELLTSREHTDLEGLVLLRRELGEVRGRIEQTESRRAAMTRQVALSTIRVAVHGRDATPRTQSGWDRFTRGLGQAWSDGLRTLERSVQGLLAFVVGRVVWWAPGVALVWVGWRVWRSRA